MGNRKAKPLDAEMRVDSTADLQESSSDLTAPPNSDAIALSACSNGEEDANWNRHLLASTAVSGSELAALSLGKRFKAVNLDENGKFIQFGFLEVATSEIVFHRVPNEEAVAMTRKPQNGNAQYDEVLSNTAHMPPIRWPFHLLRRYGYDQDLFTIETGRRACTGAGIYAFHTNHAAELFRNLQEAIKLYSVKLRKKKEKEKDKDKEKEQTTARSEPETKQQFGENSTGDFMHWSPVLVALDTAPKAPDATDDTPAIAQSESAPQSIPGCSAYETSSQPKHNYVNMQDKQRDHAATLPSRMDAISIVDGDDAHEYNAPARPKANANEERKYENLPQLEEQKQADSYYVNVASPRDAAQRDANGHLPGCPCHLKSGLSKVRNRESSVGAACSHGRQLNYVELDLRSLAKTGANDAGTRADCAESGNLENEENAASLSETKLNALNNASINAVQSVFSLNANGGGTGSSSPSGTSSSVFSANSKLAQVSTSFLGLSESRQPLLSSGSIGSASGACATLVLAKGSNQSRPNSDSLAQTHVCAAHKHVMNSKELIKHCGSHRAIQYTQIDFERTTALTNSKKSLEGPRSSVTKELTSNKKTSVDSITGHSTSHRKEKTTNDDNPHKQSTAVSFGSSPPKVANMLVNDLLKRSRHNSNN